MSQRYVVQAKTYDFLPEPVFFYLHDSQDVAPDTMVPGTVTHATREAAQVLADRLNATDARQQQRSGRNGLTSHAEMEA